MAVLTAEDRASRDSDIQAHITANPTLVTISRGARGTNIRGAAEVLYTDVPMRIFPAISTQTPALLAAVPSVGGARVSAVGFAEAGTDIQIGDDITTPDASYKVQGVDTWRASMAVALNEVKPPRPST